MKILDSISSPFQSPKNTLNSSKTDENMKYELTKKYITLENGIKLYQIRALKDFYFVNKGDLGGFVESEDNLSQKYDCWVYDNAKVYGNARVYGKAEVYGNASVYENACIYGKASVYGNSKIYGKASVYDVACITDNAEVFGKAKVYDNALIYGNAQIYGNTYIFEYAKIHGQARIYGKAYVHGESQIYDDAQVFDDSIVNGNAEVFGKAKVYGDAKVYDNKWPISPFYLTLSSQNIVSCSYSDLKIGYQVRSIDEWKKLGREIKVQGIPDEEIELYIDAIRMAELHIEIAKKDF